jgi:hypothetical protein
LIGIIQPKMFSPHKSDMGLGRYINDKYESCYLGPPRLLRGPPN